MSHVFSVISADNPWNFADGLKMGDTARSAQDQYETMTLQDIVGLSYYVKRIVADDAVLVLWVPDSMLEDGLRVARVWGFRQKQIFTWTKTKVGEKRLDPENPPEDLEMAFGMGRIFRNCDEHALICTRGSILKMLESHSERNTMVAPVSREFDMNLGHSIKPEKVFSTLDRMFPNQPKLEMFARTERPGWTQIGNQIKATWGEDVRTSLANLAGIPRV